MGSILETAGEEPARFNIKLLFPTGNTGSGQPTFTTRKFAGVTRESLKGATVPLGIGGLNLLPAGVAPAEWALDEVEFKTPDDVELVEGGTYLVMQPVASNNEQVDTLQRWQDSYIEADQEVGVKHAVAKLRASGHPEAKVLSVKELKTDAGMVEVGGIVIAKGCSIIVENKAKLTAEAAASLVDKIAMIRVMVASAETSSITPLGQLKGTQLLPVLCGRAVTPQHHEPDKDGGHLPAAQDRVLGRERVGCGAELGWVLQVAVRAPLGQGPRQHNSRGDRAEGGYPRGRRGVIGTAMPEPQRRAAAVHSPWPRHARPAAAPAPVLSLLGRTALRRWASRATATATDLDWWMPPQHWRTGGRS